jgi:hypothetical protein
MIIRQLESFTRRETGDASYKDATDISLKFYLGNAK